MSDLLKVRVSLPMEPITNKMTKPLGIKAYGSICHLDTFEGTLTALEGVVS